MPRSIWKGAISFGMISIPVKLYSATESKDAAFNQLHEKDHARIRQKRWCSAEDKEVPADEIVRGFEYEKGQYVILTDEDLEKLPVPSKHTIELSAFVKDDEIDPVYFEKSYYLEPDAAGKKPYALLVRSLAAKKVLAVAKVALRNRERLCVLRPMDNVLVLDTLYYADEVRLQDQPKAPDLLVSKQELAMAHSLIELLQEDFQPEKYQDTYREAVSELVEAKKKGKKVVTPADTPRATKPTDLMAALKASLEAAKKSPASSNGKAKTAGRKPRASKAA